jgi:tetratricopeptide (TPR) repeat protein
MCAVLIAGMAFTGFECSSTELTSAKLYIQQKNMPKALEALQKEVEKNPKSDEGYYLMGYIYGEKEQIPEMISAFDKSLGISKKFEKQINDQRKFHWANFFNKGVGLYNKGANAQNQDSAKIFYDKAISTFNNAILLEPDSADSYKNLSYVYLSAQRYDEAVKPLEKLISIKKVPEGYRFLGEILYNKGYNGMSKYGSSKVAADSITAMENYNKAVSVLEEGRKNFPNDSDILLLLSNAYIGANKISVAIDAFKAGVEKDPKNKYYRYNYGVLLLGANNFQAASEQFAKAIEVDPEYENAIHNLAVSYVKWGVAISKEIDDKKLDPNSAEYKEKSAQVKEKFSAAIPHMEKVVKMKPNDASMWELLGKVYANVGQNDKANDAYKKADSLKK